MASASDAIRPRARMRLELWSWTSWLLLGIISYPAVVLARLSPWAGLVGGALAGGFLVARAGLGYYSRRDLDYWSRALLIAAGAAGLAGLAAATIDQGEAAAIGLVVGLTFSEMVFAWYFLPAIVRDAEAAEQSADRHFQLLPWVGRGGALVRPSLGLALLLGFLALGVGAIWQRAETWAPHPGPWFVGVALLALGLMFVERMGSFERSAREGNLEMPAGSFGRWIAAAAAMLLIASLLGAVGPRRTAQEVERDRPAGSAWVEAPTGIGRSVESAASAVSSVAKDAFATASGDRRQLMISLLLLLLLLLLISIYVLSRTRAGRWLMAAIGAALARVAKAWHRLAAVVKRLFSRRPKPEEAAAAFRPETMPDPLFDVFDYPELAGGLSPRELLIRTYHLLLNYAEMLGHGRRTGQTPFEYAREVETEVPRTRDGLRALTWGYAGAMYGGVGAALPDPNAVRLAWRQTAEALKSEMSPEDFELRRRAYLAARQLEWASRR